MRHFDPIPDEFVGMKALTVKQPYASLITKGWKRIETRSWHTSYRGDLIIHSAQTQDKEAVIRAYQQFEISRMPLARVLCIVRLDDCIPQECVDWAQFDQQTERKWGYWQDGHYAWLLSNVRLVDNFGATGRLKLWTLK